MWANSSWANRSASAQSIRCPAWLAMSMPASTAVSIFSPNPFSSRMRWLWHASRSSSRVLIFSSRWRMAARFGPSPGTRSRSRTLAGISAKSSRSIGNEPSSKRVLIFSARSLPMPSKSVSLRFGSAAMSFNDSGNSRIVRAALR